MIGETVTHYRILDRIGEGGMGVVYRAEDTRLGRQVAVKFLSSKLSQDQSALDRFQREARAASSLNHPHICALYDIGRHGDLPFLVMELLDGSTLRRRIGGLPLPLDMVIDLAVQTTEALETAHNAGIVHRDIKSANIFVTERGQVKVLDFGLAKLINRAAVPGSTDTTTANTGHDTGTGHTLGTLSYMSPEQARGEELDGRTDLFSFGIVLYEMATGRDPFEARTSALIFDSILHYTPAPPSAINPRIPAELDHIIAKALEKDRDLRYQTVSELRADLKRLKRETGPTRMTPTAPATAPIVRDTSWSRRRVAMLAIGGLFVAAAAYAVWSLGTWSLWSRTPPGAATYSTIAVLPFQATGSGTDTEYLTDGITESLINGLARLPDLRVSARSVVFKYKGQNKDPQEIGRELQVRAIVTGRVTTRGDRLVIQAELMDVDNATQLWGDQYNRTTADLLAVQDEIAGEILDKLRPRLSGEDKKKATKRYTENAEAYQLYLQGRYHANKGTIASYKKAIEYYQQAIGKDPKYALAYAGLADASLSLGSYWVEATSDAKAAAINALQLDASLAEAHVALGNIKLWLDWDWPAAEREFTQGIALNDNLALAHDQYGVFLTLMDRGPNAATEIKRALDLEPLSPIFNNDLGWALLYNEQYSDAVAQFRKTLEYDPNAVSTHRGLGIAHSQNGRHADAITELKLALSLSESSPLVLGQLGAAYARQGNKTEAAAVLKNLQEQSTREYVPSSALAVVHMALGDKKNALDALDKAYEEHDFSIVQIGVAPWFKPLRTESRFTALLEKLKLK